MYISIQNAAGDAYIISYNTCTYKMGRGHINSYNTDIVKLHVHVQKMYNRMNYYCY